MKRSPGLNMDGADFRALGHDLVDRIADFLDSLPDRPITRGESPEEIRALLDNGRLPDQGTDPGQLLSSTAELLFDHSLHNGHPRFMGYITSSAAPLGALADLLAASVNTNVGLWDLSPVATEIEVTTVRWLAELIGMPDGSGGVMVSGGNMANILALLAARRWKSNWDIRDQGLSAGSQKLTVYASEETHTWLQKAADVSGIGTSAIRWIPTTDHQRLDVSALADAIQADLESGQVPFMVVGTAGSVSTGAIDPLAEIASICDSNRLWFHIDGAYGAPAACVPELADLYRGMELADSIALDPHKWLYAPLEAACTLVRDPRQLVETFSFHPDYYRLESQPGVNFYEYGLQNSRGFRALKVWLGLRAVGRSGYVEMIRDDIALAQMLHEAVADHSDLEVGTSSLSIVTFRYRPPDLAGDETGADDYLNALNEEIVNRIQSGGEAYLSNAIVNGRYLLRACIVNFRTTESDVRAIPQTVIECGSQIHKELGGRLNAT